MKTLGCGCAGWLKLPFYPGTPTCWVSSRFPDVFFNPFNPFSEQALSCSLKGIFHAGTPRSSLFSLGKFTPAGGRICFCCQDLLFSTSSPHPTSALSGWRATTQDKAVTLINPTRCCYKAESSKKSSVLAENSWKQRKSWIWPWILPPWELCKVWIFFLPVNPVCFLGTKRVMELKKTNYLICIFNEDQTLHKHDMSFNSI